MKNPFPMSQNAHFMQGGAVAFVPGWVILFIIILSVGVIWPDFFGKDESREIINPAFFAFIVGSLMPVFDDLLAYIIGKPFAHHSLFHSPIGSLLTFLIFLIIGEQYAMYALTGNLSHIFFNFYLDRVTLIFPLSYREFGLADFLKITTRTMKVIHYPVIFLGFTYAIVKFFLGI